MAENQSTHSPTTHALYRLYTDGGQLLYVGITVDPGARFAQHRASKAWWHDVAGISIERYPDRRTAFAAEARAIEVENPLHNVVRPSLANKRRAAPSPRPPAREIVWLCQACGQPVTDGTGYIHVNHMEIAVAERAERDFMARTTTPEGHQSVTGEAWHDALDLLDTEARWQVHHGTCDPHPDSGDYWFDVARARTHAHLLQRTAHLMEKRWLDVTDWAAFIRRAAGVDA